jgi:hypothetical protein
MIQEVLHSLASHVIVGIDLPKVGLNAGGHTQEAERVSVDRSRISNEIVENDNVDSLPAKGLQESPNLLGITDGFSIEEQPVLAVAYTGRDTQPTPSILFRIQGYLKV